MTAITTPMTDLVEDGDTAALRAGVRRALAESSPAEARDAWALLADRLDLAGLLIPESCGGSGGGLRDAAAVARELGRALSPAPFLTSSVLTAAVLLEADAPDDLLRALASDGQVGVVLVPATQHFAAPFSSGVTATRQSADGGEVVLSGQITPVVGAELATTFVVPAWLDGQPALGVASQVTEIEAVPSMDTTRPVTSVRLESVPARLLAVGDQGATALSHGLRAAAAVLCAERVGIQDWLLETTTAYLTQRRQFGFPIGSYQSLRHRAARMWITIGQASAAAAHAAAAHDQDPDEATLATAVAAAWTTPHCLEAAEEAMQLHGGIGFTWEHPLHRYLKRSVATTSLFGVASDHEAVVARRTGLTIGRRGDA